MGFDVGVVVCERFDAVFVKALLSNPREGIFLLCLIRRNTGGNHLFPALFRIAAVGEQEDELAIVILHLDSKKTVCMTGNVNQFDRAVAEKVIGLADRTLSVVPLELGQGRFLPPLFVVAHPVRRLGSEAHFISGDKELFSTLDLLQAVGVVAVEVGQQYGVNITVLDPHFRKLLVDTFTERDSALIDFVEDHAAEGLDLRFFVELTVGAHISCPAGIDKKLALGVLDQISRNRQPKPVLFLAEYAGSLDRVSVVTAKGQVGRYTNLACVEYMDFNHFIFLLIDFSFCFYFTTHLKYVIVQIRTKCSILYSECNFVVFRW